MKKIEAIIRETKFQEVKTKLTKLGIRGLTAYEVRGRGEQVGLLREGGNTDDYMSDDLVPKMKLEIVCIEEEVNKITSSIVANAYTGNSGDGKIFIYDVKDVIKISTGKNASQT
ncbi:P-II family nitrogen regulator [Candidatus Nitrosopumilus sediminis]|uniref:Nitrogen regulatory protein P-II n=1 Tax=Candidatus Nitrosopumilus sediminis TaxID=1229909 RepID=K0BEN0_9ARCH|nr:P-II family nitrogen regulator [Candidatus Nitrosopumilus sediminis]AFS83497.1 nitrogen regulatory protein P-II [Candidatus Nitrosopumilus sediminis]